MRKTMVLALAAAVALSAGAARADKSTQAFVDGSSQGLNGFVNINSTNSATKTYSTGSAKQSGCKIKISFKGLRPPTANGDKLICILGADACIVPPPGSCTGARFGSSVVALVPWDGILLKGGTKVDTGPIGCGGADATATNADITCYRPSAAYSVTTNTPGSPAAQCASQGGLWLANSDFVPGEEASDGLLGLCNWVAAGPGSQRLAGPGTPVVAIDGVSTPAPAP